MRTLQEHYASQRRLTLNTLLVVSHVCHYRFGDQLFAYGPYALEIDIWADLFPRVYIAAPCHVGLPPGDTLALRSSNIRMVSLPETGGTTLKAKLHQVAMLPALISRLAHTMKRVDVIHVRCPGNVGLLGVILAPIFARYRIAKYAGQWNGYQNEPATVWLQRAILRSSWWRSPVTVYGEWPDQPQHVIPFFTPIMTSEQMRRAKLVAATKTVDLPLRVLFAGRLVSAKRVSALIDAIRILKQDGVQIELAIVGDGPERDHLRQLAEHGNIQDSVEFVGALSFEEVLNWYKWAHCLVLPSVHSEGWPKVLAEAMCHGLICIAVDHGQIASMLSGRGILLSSGSTQAIAGALRSVVQQPENHQSLMRTAALWAQQFTLEGLREALRQLFIQWWQLDTHQVSS